ncbi:MAG: hypothetical protein ACUVTP_12295 [Candidatus Fervidibacter sp.]|uniref:hypothetical protein n=1 Tax=Candidatus Fervidibacter sp. TaxID=3100871 RepID=UPI00404992BF
MSGKFGTLLQRLFAWFWFAVLTGTMARLGDEIRLYSTLRCQRRELQSELQRLDQQITVLQNKLRFLYTPEGVGLVQRTQLSGTGKEKLLVFEDGLPPISILDLLPGGLEEWNKDRESKVSKRNRWLVSIPRHRQRLRNQRYR